MFIQTSISPQRHRNQARENHDLAIGLVDGSPLWGVVIAFYAALHYLDEYAACAGERFHNHRERRDWLFNQIELQRMVQPYESLYSLAGIARYDCPHAGHHTRKPVYLRRKVLPWVEQVRSCIDTEKMKSGYVI